MGAVTPLGNTMEETWEGICRGKSGIAPITRFDCTAFDTKIAGELKGFDPLGYVNKKELRRLDDFIIYALAAAEMALADAGLVIGEARAERTGVIIGSGIGGILTWEGEHSKFIQQGPARVSPFLIPMMIPDMTSGYIAIEWGLKGPNYTITSACASGAHSIGAAFNEIRLGKADAMITGGAESPITPFAVAGFSNMRALSRSTADPKTVSRPFDRDRDGFVIAEGSGIFVLEELEFARRRGARIYAELAGFGASGDGFHITAPAPDGDGARRCMAAAIADAGCQASDIDYINAHGTSTDLNDKYEIKAIRDLFGDYASKIAVNSTKSMIGHTLGAAGAIEGIITVLSIQQSTLHTSLNLVNIEPECAGVDHILGGKQSRAITYSLSNSFGFGGHNATLCFKKYIP